MSNSPISGSGRFAGQGMSVSTTCNILSQYIKEKRSSCLSPGTSVANDDYGDNRATMNLFPMTGKPVSGDGEDTSRCIGHSVNLFPQFSGFNSSTVPNTSLGKRGSPEPSTGQMTIFYGGQVLVFNDLPADKAKEIMDLASGFGSSLKKRKVEPPTSSSSIRNASPNANLNLNPNPNPNPYPDSNVIPSAAPLFRIPVPNASDMPIARKASLHRFLEKRKDRLIGKVPPSVDLPSSGSSNVKTWLGLSSLPIYRPLQQL